MTTMKAPRFEKYGPPSVLSIQEFRVPDLRPGQALVEVRAAAVNPSDGFNVAGRYTAVEKGLSSSKQVLLHWGIK
jgi:NADPH:quinone reductase-like Zn-dependent oxidoreductase